MNIEDSVVSHFTSSVSKYPEKWSELEDFAKQAFKPIIERRSRVLELGCGTGHRLEGLSTYYPKLKLYGMDITPAMVKKARAIQPELINFMVGDCLHNPFKGGEFDAVLMYYVLHHLIKDNKKVSNSLREKGFRELLRLLAPKGFIILGEVCVNTAWRSALIFFVSHLLSKFHISLPMLDIGPDVVTNFFTLEELQANFDRLGLSVVSCQIEHYKNLSTWLSTFGSFTYHVIYTLRRKEETTTLSED